MPRVLHRAASLLTAIAEQPDRSTTVLAAAAGLAPATAARLLADLRGLGLVDQDGRRSGWRLGPALHALTRRQAYHDDLIARVQPHAEALRRRFACGVVLTVLRGEERVELFHREIPGRPVSTTPLPRQHDVVETAGGRLLLALQPAARRRDLCGRLGLPGPAWPGLLTRRELDAELRTIARAGWYAKVSPPAWGVAAAIRGLAHGPAALGAYLRDAGGADHSALRDAVIAATRAVSAGLPPCTT